MNSMFDVIIIGGGAAGLMCAIAAGRRGRRVCLLEHNAKVGSKILISGGGRCNFTNLGTSPDAFISGNPHFVRSALAQYGPADFMNLLARYNVTWHEKTLGQLFCDQKAGRIIEVLEAECNDVGVEIRTGVKVEQIEENDGDYILSTSAGPFKSSSLVIATGGLSIPKLGATDFAYQIARQFGLKVVEPKPALVPFVFEHSDLAAIKPLAGVAADSIVSHEKQEFRESLLFTHRGLSGPAILQISSYWYPGSDVKIDLAPQISDLKVWMNNKRQKQGKQMVVTVLSEFLPKRLAGHITSFLGLDGSVGSLSSVQLTQLEKRIKNWSIRPSGTEGFLKAEVTRGGVDTHAISSKTMEAKAQKGLYFIGECVDVTGWLGGYNFQWAWSSGWAAGQAV